VANALQIIGVIDHGIGAVVARVGPACARLIERPAFGFAERVGGGRQVVGGLGLAGGVVRAAVVELADGGERGDQVGVGAGLWGRRAAAGRGGRGAGGEGGAE